MRTCAQAGSIRAMPETEIPRATRVDIYCIGKSGEYKIIYAIYAKRRFPYIYLENCKKKKSKGG